MKRGCPREPEVLAVYRPQGDARRRTALADHLAGCPACRRAAQLSSALAALAAEGPGFDLPDPSRIYWRSQVLGRLAAREEAAEKAVRPLVWLQLVAALVAAAIGTLAVGTFGLDLVGKALGTAEGAAATEATVTPLVALLLAGLAAAAGWGWWVRASER